VAFGLYSLKLYAWVGAGLGGPFSIGGHTNGADMGRGGFSAKTKLAEILLAAILVTTAKTTVQELLLLRPIALNSHLDSYIASRALISAIWLFYLTTARCSKIGWPRAMSWQCLGILTKIALLHHFKKLSSWATPLTSWHHLFIMNYHSSPAFALPRAYDDSKRPMASARAALEQVLELSCLVYSYVLLTSSRYHLQLSERF